MVSQITPDDRALIISLYREHGMSVITIAEKWEARPADILAVIRSQEVQEAGLRRGARSQYTVAEIKLFLEMYKARSEDDTYNTLRRRFNEKVPCFDAVGRIRILAKPTAVSWVKRFLTDGLPIRNAADSPMNGIDTV